MEILMSNWPDVVQSLPENYIFPPDKRPGRHVFPVLRNIPLIDLAEAGDHAEEIIVQQILQASQEFGFFQVINYGIRPSLMEDTMNVFKEFFAMPADYKACFYSTNVTKKCRLYSSTMNYGNEEVHYWRDNFTHHCYPLDDQIIHQWPDEPSRYREVVGEYSMETRRLALRILNFVCRGLGLELGYFEGELSKIQLLSVNHHIPCPDPSLTLGMPEHCDPNLITMLHQGSVPGLQVFHQAEWMNIEPTPNALIVVPGLQLKVISNGKFTSPIHRVITHAREARTTIGIFLNPSQDTIIEPAKGGATDARVLFRGFTYKEFYATFIENCCDADAALKCFENNPIITSTTG